MASSRPDPFYLTRDGPKTGLGRTALGRPKGTQCSKADSAAATIAAQTSAPIGLPSQASNAEEGVTVAAAPAAAAVSVAAAAEANVNDADAAGMGAAAASTATTATTTSTTAAAATTAATTTTTTADGHS